MSAEITLICEKCSFPIAHGHGCIYIQSSDVEARGRIRWHTAHDACLSEEPVYDLDAHEIASTAALRLWTEHLMGKSWYAQSDWSDLLREVSGEIPAVRVRVESREAA